MLGSGFPALFALTLLLPAPLLSQAAGAPTAGTQGPTIVTLNFNNAVLSTAEAQQELSALQKKYAPR